MGTILQLLISGIAMGFIYALVAIEYTLIWNSTGLLNFSHDKIITVGAYIFAATFIIKFNMNKPLAIVLTFMLMGILGSVIASGIFNPLRHMRSNIFAVMGTMMLGRILAEAIRLIYGPVPFTIENWLSGTIKIGTLMVTKANVIICVVAILVVAALQLFMNFTKIGKAMRCVAQNKKAAALMGINVAQNICVVPKLLKYDKARCDEIVQEMLQLVHMEQSANKYPSELSGGQQQRIGVLRALAASPPIVLMDEPFSALDPLTRESLQDEVKNLQQKLNKTIVFVSHDMSEALKLADIIIFMAAGEIVQMASPEEMLEHPANDLVRTFMGKHTPDTAPSKVESFMRTNVFSVRKDRGVLECAERMARGSVDTLLVTDEQNRYLGTISIGDIRHWGRELTSIEPLIRQTARTVRVGDEAKESFDYLLDSGANYVVVLNADDTIAGIVTKTSVARSVAENLWGDSK